MVEPGQEKIQKGFYPLLPGFRYLPYNDIESLEQLVSEKTCAVLLELVQGEGGVIPADPAWIQKIAALCKENDVLLMIDEIQTGMGRTGTLFAYEQYEIEPDVISVAKGLGSGFPIGAIIANEKCAVALDPGSHGSTFGGNPLAATAGLATVEHLVTSEVIENAAEMGAYLEEGLEELKSSFTQITAIRGKGLLQGIVVKDAIHVVEKARQHHILILVAGPDVVRILPPLTTTRNEIDQFLEVLKSIFLSSEN
jgi:acetylornithine aminotransferase